MLTLLDFSLVFLSSNLLNGVIEGCDWVLCFLLAYASCSSLCSLRRQNKTVQLSDGQTRGSGLNEVVREQLFCQFWVVPHKDTRRQTFQRVPSLPESVFAFLVDFLLANTWSTGLAKQCCHKTHILFCKAALIGPDGFHAAGSSSFKRKTAGWRQKCLKNRTVSSSSNCTLSKYTTDMGNFYDLQRLNLSTFTSA